MTNRTITTILCAALLLPLVLGAWLVHRRTVAREAATPHEASVDVVMHQPSYYRRLDSIARDSARRDSLAHRSPQPR